MLSRAEKHSKYLLRSTSSPSKLYVEKGVILHEFKRLTGLKELFTSDQALDFILCELERCGKHAPKNENIDFPKLTREVFGFLGFKKQEDLFKQAS